MIELKSYSIVNGITYNVKIEMFDYDETKQTQFHLYVMNTETDNTMYHQLILNDIFPYIGKLDYDKYQNLIDYLEKLTK